LISKNEENHVLYFGSGHFRWRPCQNGLDIQRTQETRREWNVLKCVAIDWAAERASVLQIQPTLHSRALDRRAYRPKSPQCIPWLTKPWQRTLGWWLVFAHLQESRERAPCFRHWWWLCQYGVLIVAWFELGSRVSTIQYAGVADRLLLDQSYREERHSEAFADHRWVSRLALKATLRVLPGSEHRHMAVHTVHRSLQ